MAKQKSKDDFYKPGQLITIDNIVYRIKRMPITNNIKTIATPLACGFCDLLWKKSSKICYKYCFNFNKSIPVYCYLERIKPI